eukprot:CAMPEP_0197863904 /NCGR_PEP_ID=MMETSP1438-20131217/41709_1 /TAXON_ID=1461541 /ORGANISM="Pterosperma sp., Strain CCMP1384" /LENGTH=310 /DNA_ID=CAMNT_0043481961 /DNA_START=118 /DNA_END=1047 /DNA_ORIENTATION=-
MGVKVLQSCAAAVLLLLAPSVSSYEVPGPSLLREWPVLTAHQAATTYLEATENSRWVKTQPDGGFGKLLGCGARGLDVTPSVRNGQLEMHRDDTHIKQPLEAALREVVEWTSAHPGELVLVYLNQCQGVDCLSMTKELVNNMGLASIDQSNDCAVLENLTVDLAIRMGKQEGGGSLLVIWEPCVVENPPPSDMQCNRLIGEHSQILSNPSNQNAEKVQVSTSRRLLGRQMPDGEEQAVDLELEYSCFDDETKHQAFETLYGYMNQTLRVPSGESALREWRGRPSNRMWLVHAHWAVNAESMQAGGVVESS